ncbi:AMP-binding protein [Bacillus subtilis subsp. subtilis]
MKFGADCPGREHLPNGSVEPAILTKPSLEMSAAVLGVLKAGAAFVPIDPDYPDQRIEYILQDSGAKLLLKQEGISVPDSFTGDVILLDGSRTILSLPLDENDEGNPETAVTAENLAYMIYTSGTTGQPKGVMVEHHALVNLCFWHHDAFSMTAEDRSAKYAGLWPTRSSGLMPQSIRIRARRFAFAFSSPYVQDWPLYVTAGRSLWRWTVSSNS